MERVLLGAGPHESFIIMCSCGATEVTRAPKEWRRFKPCYRRRRCYCEDCDATKHMDVLEEDFYGADRTALLGDLFAQDRCSYGCC